MRSKRIGFYKETISHANTVTFKTASFLTPRSKAFCKEVGIFATASNFAHIVGWQDAKMRLLLEKRHIYEDMLFYGLAETLAR